MILINISLIIAKPDLIVKDFEIQSNPSYRELLDYKIYIKNIGDEPTITQLVISINTSTDIVSSGWFKIIDALSNNFKNESQRKIMIQKEDGTIRYQESEEATMIIPGIKGEELEKKIIETLQKKEFAFGLTEEEIYEKFPKEIQYQRDYLSKDLIITSRGILIKPGETVVWDTTNYPKQGIRFYKGDYSLEENGEYVDIFLIGDYFNYTGMPIEDNKENNFFRKYISNIKGGVIKGPHEGSLIKRIPSLDENEFFVSNIGCAKISETRICFGDEAEGLIFSVDDEKEVIAEKNVILEWITKLLKGGKGPSTKINGIEISSYFGGFKIKLPEVYKK
jgi:hypothetical protein